MKQLRLLPLLGFLFLPAALNAQDARSLAIGGAATASPMDIFGFFWNPSILALPTTTNPKQIWTVGSGFSAFDSSNTNSPILQYNDQNAANSSADPVLRHQELLGTFGVKLTNTVGGVLYDQDLSTSASQGSLSFFNDRAAGPSALLGNIYNLGYSKTQQKISTLYLSYGSPFPLGTVPFFSVGVSVKYHLGLEYNQTHLTGTYTQGSPLGYQYTQTTSTSGLGFSLDTGFFAKVIDSIQVGMMFENIQSNFNWQAQKRDITLDPNTGAETQGPPTNVTVNANFP